MKIYTDLSTYHPLKETIVTIGSFDGVHVGHQKIINEITTLARKKNLETTVITFHPHPRLILNPNDQNLRLLTTLEEKSTLLAKLGIDHLVVVPFTLEFSQLTAHQYIREFLFQNFKPHSIVIGYDHRFGTNREGGVELLKIEGEKLGFQVFEIPVHLINELAVSSSKIRSNLENNHFDQVKDLLGYNYILSGKVVKGDQLGRTIGFPTANIFIQDKHKLIPGFGIYTVRCLVNNRNFNGMLYIGQRPSLPPPNNIRIEVNIFDFNEDIYDQNIKLELIAFERNDKKFSNLDELKAALQSDEIQSRLRIKELSL
jgi:riboflavin kinase / FMN adenylyltransferase